MSRNLWVIIFFFVFILVCIGCAADDTRPGTAAVIPEAAREINFFGGAEGPVDFEHERHSTEFFDGVCLFCHDHEAITADTHWSCRDCHSAGEDIENLCDEADIHHGCIMTQCQICHDLQGPPAPDGLSCGVTAGGCHN